MLFYVYIFHLEPYYDYACTFLFIAMYIYMYVCMYVCMCVCMYNQR